MNNLKNEKSPNQAIFYMACQKEFFMLSWKQLKLLIIFSRKERQGFLKGINFKKMTSKTANLTIDEYIIKQDKKIR